MQHPENTVQSPNAVSMSRQRRRLSTLKQHWVNATCLCKVYSKPSYVLLSGQRCRRLSDIEPAMGCDAGPELNRNLVGRPTSAVRGTS